MNKIPKVYTGVDIFKMVAAIGIVAIHTNVLFFKTLGRLGVPFFVIISSFFFFNHYLKLNNRKDKKSYLIKYLKRIGCLYLCWQILYIPLAVVAFKHSMNRWGGISVLNIIRYLYTFIYPGYTNNNGWGQSWFLISLLIGIPLFLFLYKYLKLWTLTILSLVIELYYVLANEFSFITHLSVWGTLYFPRILIYILIGFYVVKYKNKIFQIEAKKSGLVFLIFLVLFITENYIIFKLGGSINSEEIFTTVPTSLSMVLFALNWQVKIQKDILIRNFSTFLYCNQIWPIRLINKFLVLIHMGNENNVSVQLILFLGVIVESLVLFLIYLKLRKSKKWIVLNYLV